MEVAGHKTSDKMMYRTLAYLLTFRLKRAVRWRNFDFFEFYLVVFRSRLFMGIGLTKNISLQEYVPRAEFSKKSCFKGLLWNTKFCDHIITPCLTTITKTVLSYPHIGTMKLTSGLNPWCNRGVRRLHWIRVYRHYTTPEWL